MRTRATIFSFFLVLAAYFLYGWALVPLVLPNPSGRGDLPVVRIDPEGGIVREEIAHFLNLLPEGEWERDPQHEIHFLQFDQIVVLFGKDDPKGKLLRLQPCTVLMLPSGHEHLDEETLRQTIILRTPQYAEIEFDRDYDISKIPLPKPVSGTLFGKVSLKSDMSDPGPQDDLYLETEDIRITDSPGLTRIETAIEKEVRFNWGLHSGTGTGLLLEVAQSDLMQSQAPKELSSVRFQRIRSLNLVFPEESGVTTLDVQSRGRFEFAANPTEQGWTASFYQDVTMVRTNPDKTVDKLIADEVHLTLTEKPEENFVAAEGNTSPFSRLEPVLFVAQGRKGQNGQAPVPARLSVKQGGDVTLVGDQIYVDLRTDFLSLSTRPEAGASPFVEIVVADQYTIRSDRCVEYTLGQDGAFGKFASEGKGTLTGKAGEGTAAKDIHLAWNEMRMMPHPVIKDHVILMLDKGISARMTGFGTMTANKLELCFSFAPSDSTAAGTSGTGQQKSSLLLDHAIVRENVLFETASGACRVKQLNIFFTNIDSYGRALQSRWMPQMLTERPPVAPGGAVAQQTIRQVQHLEPLAPIQTQLYAPPATTAPSYANRTPNQMPPQTQAPARPKGFVETQNLLGIKSSPGGGKFEMTGDIMKMEVVLHNGQSSAEIVAIEGNVRLKENVANNVPNSAIEMAGDTVTIWNPADPTTLIKIVGQATGSDAILKGKGVELRARELNLSRQDNTFWSPGAGRLVAQTGQISMPGMPTANPNTNGTLVVEWNKDMRCDGKVLQFIGQRDINGNRVKVLYQNTMLWCNEMQILLNRQVMFFDDQSPVEPKAVEISCAHDVYVQSQQFDAQGKRKSMDSAKFTKLWYYVEKNYFVGEGPGELNSVFLGSGQGFDPINNNSAGTSGNRNTSEQLNFLAIWFQDKMQGSLLGNSKKVEFLGRKVEAAYCPVTSWNDKIGIDNLAAVRRTGYILECERLVIEEMPNPVNLSQSSMELTAVGSAIIEGSGIYGRARTIKYNQAKSTVEMDGNVTIEVTTSEQTSKQSAAAIRYNIETRAIELIQAQGLGIQ